MLLSHGAGGHGDGEDFPMSPAADWFCWVALLQERAFRLKVKKGRKEPFPPLLFLVPKAGLEPARVFPTTPSRWRVYQIPPLRRSGQLILVSCIYHFCSGFSDGN